MKHKKNNDAVSNNENDMKWKSKKSIEKLSCYNEKDIPCKWVHLD